MVIRLKINHIVLRYDNVSPETISKHFCRSNIPSHGVVLSKDFFWKRSISTEELSIVLDRIANSSLGDEMIRLSGLGLTPVLHVDFTRRTSWTLFSALSSKCVRRLARRHGGFSTTVRISDVDYVAEVTQESVALLDEMGCSIELS